MTFEESLNYVSALAPRGWRLGLDRMSAFVQKLGIMDELGPEKRSYIHVAGTNGKGSTCAFLQNLLLTHGESCGTFISPFVYNPRERIVMNGEMISELDFCKLVEKIKPIAESFDGGEFGGVTEFEFKTAMGFHYWADKNAKFVALETGLGGRLDATNVVTPRASIITSISLDHQAILGHTEREIAWEKAGIIKPNVPAIIGKVSNEAYESIQKRAEEIEAPIFRFGVDFGISEKGNLYSPWREVQQFPIPTLAGSSQTINLCLSYAALSSIGMKINADECRHVAESTKVPGRFETKCIENSLVILDGAHNIASANHLKETLTKQFGPNAQVILVTNMVKGHDHMPFYSILKPIIELAIVSPINFHRALHPTETIKILSDLEIQSFGASSAEAAIEVALSKSKELNLPIVVTGSFYLVGEIGNQLQLSNTRP